MNNPENCSQPKPCKWASIEHFIFFQKIISYTYGRCVHVSQIFVCSTCSKILTTIIQIEIKSGTEK